MLIHQVGKTLEEIKNNMSAICCLSFYPHEEGLEVHIQILPEDDTEVINFRTVVKTGTPADMDAQFKFALDAAAHHHKHQERSQCEDQKSKRN